MRFALTLAMILSASAASADPPRVLADIAPVHSIVANVMSGVGEPALLLPASADPHHFQLRPSQAAELANSEVLVWVGEGLTPWLASAIETTASSLQAEIEMLELHALPMLVEGRFTQLSIQGGNASRDDAPEVKEHEQDDGGQNNVDENEQHEDMHSHGHGDFDPHLWLDPLNAARLATETAQVLSKFDPDNREIYYQNAARFSGQMANLVSELQTDLAPFQNAAMITHHDAFAYFWIRFGLDWAGGITTGESIPASAARLATIRERADLADKVCMFSQNGVGARALEQLGKDGSKIADLDQIGMGLEPGPELYEALIRRIAKTVQTCTDD